MNQGSIFFSKNNIIVKVVVWTVVAAFVLSVFIFAGTFNLNQRAAEQHEKDLAKLNKRQVNDDDAAKMFVKISNESNEVETITAGDFFTFLHNLDEQYQKFYNTKARREEFLEKLVEAKIVELQTKNIIVAKGDYEEEINKLVTSGGFPSRQAFDDQMKQRGITRDKLEDMFRKSIQEKKLKEKISKPREIPENILKEYYEKNKSEFVEKQKLPGATSETEVQKSFVEAKDKIMEKLLKEVTDADMQKYYNEHRGSYKTPLTVKLSHMFIKSDSEAIKKSINPTDAELKQYFEENKGKYKTPRTFEIKTIVKRYDNPEMRKAITVSDSEAVEFYNKNAGSDKFRTRASVNIKNILINPKSQARVDALKPTEEELKAFYAETAEVKASHILVAAETLAIDLKKKIDGGAKLEDLAKEFSTCPSKDKGGDLGFFKRDGSMVKEFEDAAFNLKLNEVSNPVKTQFGWHIIKVTEQKSAYDKPYETVSEEVKKAYIEKKLDSNAKNLAKEIGDKVKKGENFADLAKQYSDSASKSNGGVLGVIYQDGKEPVENMDKLTGEIAIDGRVLPQIINSAFGLAVNTPSEPVKTQLGYHVIMVSDKVESKLKPLDECKNDVIEEMKNEAMKTKLFNMLTEKRLAIKGGLSFDEAAKEFSDGNKGSKTGIIYLSEEPADYNKMDLIGEVIAKAGDQIPNEVKEALKKIKFEKEITDVITLPFGVVIIKVEKINEPVIKKFEDVKATLMETFKLKKAEELSMKKLEEAKDKVKKGEDFAAVCKTYSEGFSKDNGGVVGEIVKGEGMKDKKAAENFKGEVFMPWGAIDPLVDETIFDIATNEVSSVVKSSLGYHLFKVTERMENNYKPFEEVKDKVKQSMTRSSLVSDEELKNYYEQHKSEYTTPESVKVRIITVGSQAEAEKLHGDITKNGKDFATMAREFSKDDATKSKGGDMGFITRGKVNAELEKEAFGLPVGNVSNVFKTSAGFNIIQVTEKKETKVATFDEKKNEIRDILSGPKQNEILQDYISELKNTLKIERKKDNFHLMTKYE